MVAAERSAQIEVNSMIQKGIRIAKPDLMISSFYGQPSNSTINVNISGTEGERIKYAITNLTPEVFILLGKLLTQQEKDVEILRKQ